MEDTTHNETRTCIFSKTTGIRESRKFFSLVGSGNYSSSENSENDDGLEDLADLLKQTWNIWGVSVLFNFQCEDEVELKKYGKKLREEVASKLSQEDVSYEAKMSVLDIQRPKKTDHPVVKIEVSATVTSKGNRVTVVYQGYLISWRSHTDNMFVKDNAKHLPLLLCRGTPNTMKAVHATLSLMFDCSLVSMSATPEDYTWLLPILLSSEVKLKKTHKSEITLEYCLPNLPPSNSISVKFLFKSLSKLWKNLMEDKDRVDAEEVERFHNILHSQIESVGNLQLRRCLLHRLASPTIVISGSKMKVSTVETMNIALAYFNEKALDALHIDPLQLGS